MWWRAAVPARQRYRAGTTGPARSPRAGTSLAACSTSPAGTRHYLRFAGERARPFLDLVARVDAEAPRVVVDLGCGDGSMTATLAQRWPQAQVTGVDSSASMLAAAAGHAVPGRLDFLAGDLRDWRPPRPVDVLVSNAALHWVPGHGPLLPAGPAGWRRAAGWRCRCPATRPPRRTRCSPSWSRAALGGPAAPGDDTVLDPAAVLTPAGYLDVLTAAGLTADVWETTYLHVLTGEDPVLRWVSGTVLRPVLARLSAGDAEELDRRVRRRAAGGLPGAAGRDDGAALPPGVRRRPPARLILSAG